jgi:hypothetical protein
VAIQDGRDQDARPLAREALRLALEIGDRVGQSWYLSQLSLLLARAGRKAEAGRIWGAVEAAAAFRPGGPWLRDAEGLHGQVEELRDSEFERGRQEGEALTLEQVAASPDRPD